MGFQRLSIVPLLLLGLTACAGTGGGAQPSAGKVTPAPIAAAPAPVATASAAAGPAVEAQPVPVQVPDFRITAYQGDETFGGHDGHFRAAFDAGRPVVLLYFGGL